MIEQTQQEIAEAMKERPEEWAAIYLEVKEAYNELVESVELMAFDDGVKH